MSNAGKPFFVFWSLLAIPALTILISNMGDTIVKGIRDLTLWIGTITVLPGEQGLMASMKQTVKKVGSLLLLLNITLPYHSILLSSPLTQTT